MHIRFALEKNVPTNVWDTNNQSYTLMAHVVSVRPLKTKFNTNQVHHIGPAPFLTLSCFLTIIVLDCVTTSSAECYSQPPPCGITSIRSNAPAPCRGGWNLKAGLAAEEMGASERGACRRNWWGNGTHGIRLVRVGLWNISQMSPACCFT